MFDLGEDQGTRYITFWNMRTEEGLNIAIDTFEQAILKDPNYALAYSGLADSYSLLPWYGRWMPTIQPAA
jgi:hypothetical protein